MFRTLSLLALAATGLGMQLKSQLSATVEAQQFQATNVLLSAKATQSSSPYGATGDASKAVDGNKQCSWNFSGGYNSLTHTN